MPSGHPRRFHGYPRWLVSCFSVRPVVGRGPGPPATAAVSVRGACRSLGPASFDPSPKTVLTGQRLSEVVVACESPPLRIRPTRWIHGMTLSACLSPCEPGALSCGFPGVRASLLFLIFEEGVRSTGGRCESRSGYVRRGGGRCLVALTVWPIITSQLPTAATQLCPRLAVYEASSSFFFKSACSGSWSPVIRLDIFSTSPDREPSKISPELRSPPLLSPPAPIIRR